MELKDVGEFGLIDLIKQDTINDPGTVITGIGDDAAVLLPTPRQLQLITTDMLVENIHFDLTTTTAMQLGYKAVAVNLSDIAAMGGAPRHAVVSIALPRHTAVDFVLNLYNGMKEICREYGVNIVGGDTVSSPGGLVINVAVMGEVEPAHLVKRSGAKPGDIVAVTNVLGNSSAGLALLSRGEWEEYNFSWPLVTSHLTPRPLVRTGQLLAAHGATSMDDVSDGLASELHEIAQASNVSIRVVKECIPLSPEIREAAAVLGQEPLDYALYGGEDFQLLFTMEPGQFALINSIDPGAVITKIGEVLPAGDGVTLLDETGRSHKLEPRGYNHFCRN